MPKELKDMTDQELHDYYYYSGATPKAAAPTPQTPLATKAPGKELKDMSDKELYEHYYHPTTPETYGSLFSEVGKSFGSGVAHQGIPGMVGMPAALAEGAWWLGDQARSFAGKPPLNRDQPYATGAPKPPTAEGVKKTIENLGYSEYKPKSAVGEVSKEFGALLPTAAVPEAGVLARSTIGAAPAAGTITNQAARIPLNVARYAGAPAVFGEGAKGVAENVVGDPKFSEDAKSIVQMLSPAAAGRIISPGIGAQSAARVAATPGVKAPWGTTGEMTAAGLGGLLAHSAGVPDAAVYGLLAAPMVKNAAKDWIKYSTAKFGEMVPAAGRYLDNQLVPHVPWGFKPSADKVLATQILQGRLGNSDEAAK